ncbi:hypothetical protein RIF29_35507 [Crotalaria pallida]|uniref:Secreted protein n=1 Tax=Crotalaria pallida TaxID=3830 RepID=A0AAN9HXZ6_CROPI
MMAFKVVSISILFLVKHGSFHGQIAIHDANHAFILFLCRDDDTNSIRPIIIFSSCWFANPKCCLFSWLVYTFYSQCIISPVCYL